MILNGKTQLGLAFDRYMQDELFRLHYDKYISREQDPKILLAATAQVMDLFSNDRNQNYVFRQTAIEMASKIKLDKGKHEDLSFLLDKLPEKKRTFLMGSDKFYRWMRLAEDGDVVVLCVKICPPDEHSKPEVEQVKKMFDGMSNEEIKKLIDDKKEEGVLSEYERQAALTALTKKDFNKHLSNGIFYYMWGIKDGKLHFPEDERNEDFFNEMMEFIRLLIFTELVDVETVELTPNQSTGTRKQGKWLNNSNGNVKIVDSSWNKILIKGEKFSVTGHLRMQPCGPGLKYRIPKWIDEFEKEGYTRNALKE